MQLSRLPRLALSSAVLILAAQHAREAHAFQCTPVTDANPPITQVWTQRCIPYWIDNRGTMLDGAEKRQMIAQSFRVWSGQACTDLEFLDAGYTDQGAAFDAKHPSTNQNVIVSIEDQKDESMFPMDGLLAITLTSYSVETGEIFDADILLNAAEFSFDDVTSQPACIAKQAYDLRNTLIHEMGHFIGFDHDRDMESTMFASAEKCETKKRDLTSDNILGVCTVYPKDQPAKTCAQPKSYNPGHGEGSFRCQCARVTNMFTGECAPGGCNDLAPLPDPSAQSPERALPLASLLGIAILALSYFGVRRARKRRVSGR